MFCCVFTVCRHFPPRKARYSASSMSERAHPGPERNPAHFSVSRGAWFDFGPNSQFSGQTVEALGVLINLGNRCLILTAFSRFYPGNSKSGPKSKLHPSGKWGSVPDSLTPGANSFRCDTSRILSILLSGGKWRRRAKNQNVMFPTDFGFNAIKGGLIVYIHTNYISTSLPPVVEIMCSNGWWYNYMVDFYLIFIVSRTY